jgi:hypothetical protein
MEFERKKTINLKGRRVDQLGVLCDASLKSFVYNPGEPYLADGNLEFSVALIPSKDRFFWATDHTDLASTHSSRDCNKGGSTFICKYLHTSVFLSTLLLGNSTPITPPIEGHKFFTGNRSSPALSSGVNLTLTVNRSDRSQSRSYPVNS